MREDVLWRKMGAVIMILAKRLDIEPERALGVFYQTETCRRLHDPHCGLRLMSDFYIVEDVVREMQRKHI